MSAVSGEGNIRGVNFWRTLHEIGPSSLFATGLLAAILAFVVILPLLPVYDPYGQNLAANLAEPGETIDGRFYLVGTDPLGRDMLSRLALAGRVSIFIAVSAVTISMVLGIALGLMAGFLRGPIESLIMGIADLQLSIPRVLLLIAVTSVIGPSVLNLTILLGLTSWVGYGRVARAMALSLREREFVLSAVTQGASPFWNIRKHLLPNVLPQMLIVGSFELGQIIVLEASLSYLGIGVQPPLPSWGLMISEGQNYLEINPWISVLPGIAIFMLVTGVQFISQRFTTEGEQLLEINQEASRMSPSTTWRRATSEEPVLVVRDLCVEVLRPSGAVRVVDGISFEIRRDEVFGVVGESGSGKSITMLAIMGLLMSGNVRIARGEISLGGRDLRALSDEDLRRVRGKNIAMIFQDPMTSLNPVLTIGSQIGEILEIHEPGLPSAKVRARIVELLSLVGVPNPERRMGQYPHEFSGGMRQRTMIAMAIANEPDLLIADEPTTALDVTIQAQVMDVLAQVRARTGASMILITHDLGLVADTADRVAVMYGGQIVEFADVEDLFARQRHPYTVGLLASLPRLEGVTEELYSIPGQPTGLNNRPTGCVFQERCGLSKGRAICESEVPLLKVIGEGHAAACHFADETRAWAASLTDGGAPLPVEKATT